MLVTPEQARGAAVFAAGLILVVWATLRAGLLWRDPPRSRPAAAHPVDWKVIGTLAAITLAGLALRLDGLAVDTLAHPEIYVPRIALPAEISEPPPRIALRDVLAWHFHDEPHPQAYYLVMWFWTGLFGTSEWWLRLPSVVFGAASIPLLYAAACRAASSRVALVAATLLALNGHHIFWSRLARMYAMVCFLGILGTWLLLVIIQSGASRSRIAAYIAVSWLGLFTDVLYWPFLLSHIVVSVVCAGRSRNRLFGAQMIVTMLGAPILAHAIYRARPSPIWPPTPAFLADFFAFGFLFRNDTWTSPPVGWPVWALVGVLFFSMVLLVSGLHVLARDRVPSSLAETARGWAWSTLLLMQLGAALITIALSLIAFQRSREMAAVSLLAPAAFVAALLIQRMPARSLSDRTPPVAIVALLPPLLTFAISYGNSLAADRLFLLFVPGLLILLAAGIVHLAGSKPAAVALAIAVLGLNGAGVLYFRGQSASPRDYKRLGLALAAQLQSDDLILVQRRSWITTPLFYYTGARPRQYVSEISATTARPVWLVEMDGEPRTPAMAAAVAGRRVTSTLSARGGQAFRFE